MSNEHDLPYLYLLCIQSPIHFIWNKTLSHKNGDEADLCASAQNRVYNGQCDVDASLRGSARRSSNAQGHVSNVCRSGEHLLKGTDYYRI